MSKRDIKIAISNYIQCGDYYLFLKRSEQKKVDPGKLNAVGGKLEPGEDFLTCCIRETEEETGLKIDPSKIKFCGLVRLEEGYEDDWIMAWFKSEVTNMRPKSGTKTDDGELIWMHKDEVYKSEFAGFIDDMKYTFELIDTDQIPFFMSATINSNLKVETFTIHKL